MLIIPIQIRRAYLPLDSRKKINYHTYVILHSVVSLPAIAKDSFEGREECYLPRS